VHWEFGTNSVQLRERKNGFLVPKRHCMKHLDFLSFLLESRRSVFQKHSPKRSSSVQQPNHFTQLRRFLRAEYLVRSDVYALGYCVVKVFIGLVTPSLLPLESIDSTV
jgi:hypothetical protein